MAAADRRGKWSMAADPGTRGRVEVRADRQGQRRAFGGRYPRRSGRGGPSSGSGEVTKNIAHQKDARLQQQSRDQRVKPAQEPGADLRQSHPRLGPRPALRVGRHAHARRFKHLRTALRNLKGCIGRVKRNLCPHLQDIPTGGLRDRTIARLAPVWHFLHRRPKGADMIFTLHEARGGLHVEGQDPGSP